MKRVRALTLVPHEWMALYFRTMYVWHVNVRVEHVKLTLQPALLATKADIFNRMSVWKRDQSLVTGKIIQIENVNPDTIAARNVLVVRGNSACLALVVTMTAMPSQ